MLEEIEFNKLPTDEKINICNKTQSVLKTHFPDSEFTLRSNNLEKGLEFYRKLIDDFKGCCIVDRNAVVFYKISNITDFYDKNGEFRKLREASHDPYGNCMFVDFLVADFNEDNVEDLKEFFFRPWRVEYYMMLRRGEVILKTRRDLEVLAKRVSTYQLISSLAS